MKITVLSPHRDDAAFSLGLAIERWIAASHTVEIVNCFTISLYSPLGDLSSVHADELQSHVTKVRHREDLRWSEKYSEPVMLADLNLIDAPERLHCSAEDVCAVPPAKSDLSLRAIRQALEKTVDGALLLPLGIGDHVDHLTARLAAQSGWPETLPIAFYEDLPYAARSDAAGGIEDRVTSIGSDLIPGLVGPPCNIADAVARKRQLAMCYDSQIGSDVAEQIARFCERYEGRERLWMNRAWRDSTLGA